MYNIHIGYNLYCFMENVEIVDYINTFVLYRMSKNT